LPKNLRLCISLGNKGRRQEKGLINIYIERERERQKRREKVNKKDGHSFSGERKQKQRCCQSTEN
jgi:hypothetical protein